MTRSHTATRPRDPTWQLADFEELASTACPCGQSQRAFVDVPDAPASLHRVEIGSAARAHYHKRLTEMYYILNCEPGAELELDGARVPVRPGQCCLIPPGVRHRAVGMMTILNVVVPRFDPKDEWFD